MHLKEQGGGKFPCFRSLAHCFCTVVVQTDPILPPTQLPFPWYLIQIQALNSQAGKARQYNKESLLFPSSHGCQFQPCLYLQRAALSSVSILALCTSTALASSHHFTFPISCQLYPGFPSFGVIFCGERSLTHTQIQHP